MRRLRRFPVIAAALLGAGISGTIILIWCLFRGTPVLPAPVLALAAASVAVAVTLGTVTCVTPYRWRRRLAIRDAHLRALVAGTCDVTMVVDRELRVQWLSPAAAQQFSLTDWHVVGRDFTNLLHPDDTAGVADRLRALVGTAAGSGGPVLVEARMVDGRGEWRHTESTVSDLRTTPGVHALVVQVRDVGHRRALERTLQQLTTRDTLTGLPNRRELLQALAARRGAGEGGVLLVADLEGFCTLNDLRGRSAGDAVLAVAAQRIGALVAADDLVCRLGERQFAVLTAAGPVDAYTLGFRVLQELGRAYRLSDGTTATVSPTIGLTNAAGGDRPEEVVRRADLARARASRLGGGRIDWYDEALEQDRVRRWDIERQLYGAVGRGEFDLVYQPVADLADRRPVGVEAVLRWRHPALGTVFPDELLPVAHRLGIGAEILEWLLHTACRYGAQWRRDGYDLWLAVPAPAADLVGAQVPAMVESALRVHRFPPERLVVEIAEDELDTDFAALARRLGELRALGVRVALDRVGTARSDPSWWRRLPLDLVRLCPQTVLACPPDAPVATVVSQMAHRLGLAVVADGLATIPEWEGVRAAGCRYGQGEAVAPPLPAERLEAYLEQQRWTVPR